MIKNLARPAISILNCDDRFLRKDLLKNKSGKALFSFGIKEPANFPASQIRFSGNATYFHVRKQRFLIKSIAYHNVYNALAAISVGSLFGIEHKNIARSLAGFDFPAGRLLIRKISGITFIDDTYNSNPLSLKEALVALRNFKSKGRKVAVIGDMCELGPREEELHRQAGRNIAGACDFLVAVGRLSQEAAKVAQKCGLAAGNIFACETAVQARDILFSRIFPHKNDIILVKGSRKMQMEEVLKI